MCWLSSRRIVLSLSKGIVLRPKGASKGRRPKWQSYPIAHEIRASPIAKRLAREHNLDLARLVGTGEGGRITEKDVMDYVAQQQAAASAPSPAPTSSLPSPVMGPVYR